MTPTVKLTDLQRYVLEYVTDRWQRPLDMGGHDGSSHSAVLAALVRKGLVEKRQRGGLAYYRGSYVYRLTPAGVAWRVDEAREMSAIIQEAIIDGVIESNAEEAP
jgi:hypothetical protein